MGDIKNTKDAVKFLRENRGFFIQFIMNNNKNFEVMKKKEAIMKPTNVKAEVKERKFRNWLDQQGQSDFAKWIDTLSMPDLNRLNSVHYELNNALGWTHDNFESSIDFYKALLSQDESALGKFIDKHPALTRALDAVSEKCKPLLLKIPQKEHNEVSKQYNTLQESCRALAKEIAEEIHAGLQELYDPNSNIIGATPVPSSSQLETKTPAQIEQMIVDGSMISSLKTLQLEADLKLPGWQTQNDFIARGRDLSKIMSKLQPVDKSSTVKEMTENLRNVCAAADQPGASGMSRIQNLTNHPNPIVNIFCQILESISTGLFEKLFPAISKAKNISQQLNIRQELQNITSSPKEEPTQDVTPSSRRSS